MKSYSSQYFHTARNTTTVNMLHANYYYCCCCGGGVTTYVNNNLLCISFVRHKLLFGNNLNKY